jgi:ribosomal protein L28
LNPAAFSNHKTHYTDVIGHFLCLSVTHHAIFISHKKPGQTKRLFLFDIKNKIIWDETDAILKNLKYAVSTSV